MQHYRVTIFGKDYDAMADLVRQYEIEIFHETVRQRLKKGAFSVDALADDEQIHTLEANGYKVDRHENLDKVGKARQEEVSKDDRYRRLDSLSPEDLF